MRSPATLCAAATALLLTAAAPLLPVHGFASVRPSSGAYAHTRRSTLVTVSTSPPLLPPSSSSSHSDARSLVLSAEKGADAKKDDSSSGGMPLPRGLTEIVLNTGVGALTFGGGVMGYVKAGSKASLIAGSTFGGLLLLSAFLISKKKNAAVQGNRLGSVASGLLTYVMAKKYTASGVFVPAGLLAGLGALTCFYNVVEALFDLGEAQQSKEEDDTGG